MIARLGMIAAVVLPLAVAPAFAAKQDDAASLLHAAKMDLQKGRMNAAIDKTERAETDLLNQKAAGDRVGSALNAVEKVHQDFQNKDRTAAARDIDDALNTMGAG